MKLAAESRNPYVILGVPFGVTADEARRALPAVLRRVRGGAVDLPYTMEDVTWALHQIELAQSDPHVAVDVYRIPAVPGATEPQETTPQLFDPQPRVPVVPLEPVGDAIQTQWRLAMLEQMALHIEKHSDAFVIPLSQGGI